MSATEDDNKKKANETVSDEEDNTKESTNDSDEDFNIDSYVACNKDTLETTAESSSIRYLWGLYNTYETIYFILKIYLARGILNILLRFLI